MCNLGLSPTATGVIIASYLEVSAANKTLALRVQSKLRQQTIVLKIRTHELQGYHPRVEPKRARIGTAERVYRLASQSTPCARYLDYLLWRECQTYAQSAGCTQKLIRLSVENE